MAEVAGEAREEVAVAVAAVADSAGEGMACTPGRRKSRKILLVVAR